MSVETTIRERVLRTMFRTFLALTPTLTCYGLAVELHGRDFVVPEQRIIIKPWDSFEAILASVLSSITALALAIITCIVREHVVWKYLAFFACAFWFVYLALPRF